MEESISVMHVSVLPAAVMYAVLGHGNFRSIEYGGFVHVIPKVNVVSSSGEFVNGIKTSIVLSDCWIEEV